MPNNSECTHETTISYRRSENKIVRACLDCGLVRITIDGEVVETFHPFPIVLGHFRQRFISLERFLKFLAGV